MISAIIAIMLTASTPISKPVPAQPALHAKTAVYDLTDKKRK